MSANHGKNDVCVSEPFRSTQLRYIFNAVYGRNICSSEKREAGFRTCDVSIMHRTFQPLFLFPFIKSNIDPCQKEELRRTQGNK